MENLLQNFVENNLIFLGRIIISIICGILIGFERENMNKKAGIRTHSIVALGSSLCIIISQYGFDKTLTYDASRVAAQIVSGIGFLGAGMIFVRKDQDVTGLTTAAGIWTTAIISMAIGTGMVFLGIVSTVLIVLIQWFISRIKYKLHIPTERVVFLTTYNNEFSLDNFTVFLKQINIEIIYFESEKSNKFETDIKLVLELPENIGTSELSGKLYKLNGIKYIKI